jgi:hypothetical protein
MAFAYNVTEISVLITVFVNLIANIVYALTGFSGDLVGVAVLALIVSILGGILLIVGRFLAMKWMHK